MASTELPLFFFEARREGGDGARVEESGNSPATSDAGERKAATYGVTFSRKRTARPEGNAEGLVARERDPEKNRSTEKDSHRIPAPRLVKSSHASQPRKKALTQTYLDFGQVNFAFTTCTACGMMYAKGQAEDEKLHAAFHSSCVQGITLNGWQGSHEIARTQTGACIYLIAPGDPKSSWNKAASVCELVEKQLGMPDGHLLAAACKVFLTVDERKRVTGCLVTEGPTTAHPAVLDTTEACSPASRHAMGGENVPPPAPLELPDLAVTAEEASSMPNSHRAVGRQGNSAPAVLMAVDECRQKEAVCGVKGVWVSQSARRSGVASDLLEAARRHAVKGYVVPRAEVAFSQPTEDGVQLALAYTSCSEFLVY